ncbi:ATP-binding protein [Kitasatospora atroaurantiaca]|nr:ATP-binding protein [Kitasatospora atroaurantiaca]
MTFTAWPASVGLARRQVMARLADWGLQGSRADDLLIICSELVTNAIEHASEPGGDVQVRLQEVDGDCRLEVSDPRPDLLPPRHLVVRGENGRGLLLVRSLADDMDVATTKGRKTVWARVLLPAGSGRPEVAA